MAAPFGPPVPRTKGGTRFMKRTALLLTLMTAAISFGLAQPSSAADGWCSDSPTPPCIVSASDNGTAILSTDTNWGFDVSGTNQDFLWNAINHNDGDSADLGSSELSHPWSITFDTGTAVPRIVFTQGTSVSVARGAGPDFQVTVTAHPVTVDDNGDCDTISGWPWTCDDPPSARFDAYFGGEITDYSDAPSGVSPS